MTLRGFLKQETEGHHARLDGALSELNLMDASDYGRFLHIHAAALRPVELQLEHAGVAALFDDWPRRVRRTALEADLAVLGLGRPAPAPFAPLAGADEMLGALYVLEGSRLGHAMMLRHLPKQAATRPAMTFLAHGAGERLWGGFLTTLAGREARADRGRMIAAAHRTFGAYLEATARLLPGAPAALSATPPPCLDPVS
ncbi:biliverdin-producing heme oxygenase [Aquabacter sp. L1I39]|uniref:biliverdin-producing heme oxygenase n=1 Tax=Aquabacter sp. L1I39 TaxID=2820278 RepID=UPI001AD9A65F|nr:biliverdin-producing heme oxygenase [Aquabacter sp. L1I39]QTL02166.1 biliverdin-producing heme oxygenase [Aquabacter sp. L1I39]